MLYEMGSRSLEIAPHRPVTPPRASIFIGTMAVTTADREFEVKVSYQWPGDTPREEAKSKTQKNGLHFRPTARSRPKHEHVGPIFL